MTAPALDVVSHPGPSLPQKRTIAFSPFGLRWRPVQRGLW